MVDPISIGALVLGGAHFAWEVGRSIWRSRSGKREHREETRQQITRTYSSPQLFVPPPVRIQSQVYGRPQVFVAQRSVDTYEDQGVGIQMGAGFNPRFVIPADTHWSCPFGDHGLGTVMVVDWTNRLAWAYVHVRGCYYLWYKVQNINTNFFLHPAATNYAIATVTMVDGCPVWSNVALEVIDGSGEYHEELQSSNDWMQLGIRHSDMSRGELVFVGMTRALLMGILVGRYAEPTGLNVDTVVDSDGDAFINIDSGLRSNPVRRGSAHLTVFRSNTQNWADEFVWVG